MCWSGRVVNYINLTGCWFGFREREHRCPGCPSQARTGKRTKAWWVVGESDRTTPGLAGWRQGGKRMQTKVMPLSQSICSPVASLLAPLAPSNPGRCRRTPCPYRVPKCVAFSSKFNLVFCPLHHAPAPSIHATCWSPRQRRIIASTKRPVSIAAPLAVFVLPASRVLV